MIKYQFNQFILVVGGGELTHFFVDHSTKLYTQWLCKASHPFFACLESAVDNHSKIESTIRFCSEMTVQLL